MKVEFEVTDAAYDEIIRLMAKAGWRSIDTVFSRGLTLLRIYFEAVDRGREMRLCARDGVSCDEVITVPK